MAAILKNPVPASDHQCPSPSGHYHGRNLTLFFLIIFCLCPIIKAGTITLDFEGLPDSTILTSQYPGLTFSNAMILTAGITLNEFEFPPHSGGNVASDNGGSMTINSSSPASSFSGFFTYSVPLTLRAFDSSSNQVAVATSHFSNNEVLSGNPGSSPNEFLQVSFAGGISKVTITGDPAGSSFTLDDATITTPSAPNPTPAPPTLILTLFGLALAGLAAFGARKRAGSDFGSMKTFAWAIAVVLPFGLGVVWLSASPQASQQRQSPVLRVDSFSASRTSVIAKMPTTVTLTARINHPSHITSSVNLIRLDEASGLPTILGQMHDDGKNGDAVNGDHIYTIQLALNEPSAGQIRLQVSTAFRGWMKRTLSAPLTLTINSPQKQ